MYTLILSSGTCERQFLDVSGKTGMSAADVGGRSTPIGAGVQSVTQQKSPAIIYSALSTVDYECQLAKHEILDK